METTINNTLQVFKNEELNANIRVVEIDGQPFFVAIDVCKALDIQNTTQAVAKLDDDERAMFNIGRQGTTNVVNEYGLYNLILGSRKPEAKQFKRWVTHEVLPSIRKTGKYEVPKEPESDEMFLARAVLMANGKINALKEQVAALLPKATAYDAVINKFDNISWRDVCNELKSTFGVKENEIRDKLIAERWIYKVNQFGGKSKYKPYTETIFRDLMVVKDVLCNDGKVRQGNFFTYKGREQLIDWFAPVVAVDEVAANAVVQ